MWSLADTFHIPIGYSLQFRSTYVYIYHMFATIHPIACLTSYSVMQSMDDWIYVKNLLQSVSILDVAESIRIPETSMHGKMQPTYELPSISTQPALHAAQATATGSRRYIVADGVDLLNRFIHLWLALEKAEGKFLPWHHAVLPKLGWKWST
jgi:hypothetical protein